MNRAGRPTLWRACACILVALLGACTSFKIDQDRIARKGGTDWIGHVVVADKKGGFDRSVLTETVFNTGNLPAKYECHKINEQERFEPEFALCHIKFVVDQVTEIILKKKNEGSNEKLKLVIFIHGGLNTPESSLRRVQEHTPIIKSDGYHPIFLNWHSEFGSTYYDEVRYVREGRRRDLEPGFSIDDVLTLVATPFHVLADVIRSVGQAVPLWANQIALVRENFFETYSQDLVDLNRDQAKYIAMGGTRYIFIDEAGVDRSEPEKMADHALAAATVLAKALTVPAVSSIGLRSWQNQRRRIEEVMRRPTEFLSPAQSSKLNKQEGPLAKILRLKYSNTKNGVLPTKRELDEYGKGVFALLMTTLVNTLKNRGRDNVEVTIIGHSMGAMIANNIVEVFPDFKFHNIVYMGAAESLRSVDNVVLTYLREINEKALEEAKEKKERKIDLSRFYNLMLHPIHDRFQQNQFGITPRGSLLEWIDAFFEYSNSDLDRTAGKLSNVERVVSILDELLRDKRLEGAVKLRVFGLQTGGPKKHGQFSEILIPENNDNVIVPVTFKYWLPQFWRMKMEHIEKCRGRNRSFFVKRERDSDSRTFFVPVDADDPDLLEMPLPDPDCKQPWLGEISE